MPEVLGESRDAKVVFAPPRTSTTPLAEPRRRGWFWRIGAWHWLGAAVATGALGIGLAVLTDSPPTPSWWRTYFGIHFGLVAASAGLGLIRAVAGLFTLGASGAVAWAALLLAVPANAMVGFMGFIMAVMSSGSFVRGRQIRRFGRIQLPTTELADWTDIELAPFEAPPEVVARWVENARSEHASVAAFAQLTLDLLTLGAPPQLLAAAQADAADEIRHAELCFAVAQAAGGEATGPAPFAAARPLLQLPLVGTAAWIRLGVDSLIDGALHEGISARVVARLVRQSEVPVIIDVLKTIARDEGRHAAHGWDVVLFCVERGGRPVLRALAAALAAVPKEPQHAAGTRADLSRWGLPTAELETEEYRQALVELRARLSRLIERHAASRAVAA